MKFWIGIWNGPPSRYNLKCLMPMKNHLSRPFSKISFDFWSLQVVYNFYYSFKESILYVLFFQLNFLRSILLCFFFLFNLPIFGQKYQIFCLQLESSVFYVVCLFSLCVFLLSALWTTLSKQIPLNLTYYLCMSVSLIWMCFFFRMYPNF